MEPDVIFFLTDGEIPEETPDVVRRANRRGTVIHTTAFENEGDEGILRKIAEENGGTFRIIR